MWGVRLRRLLPRHQQGSTPAVVQHEKLRKSRKTAAMALRDALDSRHWRNRTSAVSLDQRGGSGIRKILKPAISGKPSAASGDTTARTAAGTFLRINRVIAFVRPPP